MKKYTACFFFFVILLLWHAVSFADTSVWVATSGGQKVYLGGTIHMLRSWDFPLPVEFDQAYQNASIIVFETELGKLKDARLRQIQQSEFIYRDGRTLDQVLSRKAYMTLMGYSEKIGMPVSNLHPLKPSIAVAALQSVELQRNGMTEDGVDYHFYEKAVADGKIIRGLASVNEHLKYLAEEADGNEDDYVIHAIEDFKRMSIQIGQMVTMWRNGDEKGIDRLSIDQLKTTYPNLYDRLLVERNQKWMPIIESYFKTPATEFVLVGAAHLAGEHGLLKQLGDRGYTISRLHGTK
jgi:uncharacterized protein YbaP (TraB family)